MSDAEHKEESTSRSSRGLYVALLLLVGLVSAAAGFAVPYVMMKCSGPETVAADPRPPQPAFVPFTETVVNLDEGQLNRYLRVSITLQVDEADRESLDTLIQQKNVILKNWLLSYLSDMNMDDIRGAAGQNRLRREIQDYFNEALYPDGHDRIHDVLFEEFNVQ